MLGSEAVPPRTASGESGRLGLILLVRVSVVVRKSLVPELAGFQQDTQNRLPGLTSAEQY